jgi:hypothetical protein
MNTTGNHKRSPFPFFLAGFFMLSAACGPTCKYQAKVMSATGKLEGKWEVQLAVFDEAHLKASRSIDLTAILSGQEKRLEFQGATWSLFGEISPLDQRQDAYQLDIRARLMKGVVDDFSLGLSLRLGGWTSENYLLMPGAVYNGNRYRARPHRRRHLCEAFECSPVMPVSITTIPRLRLGEGRSEIKFLSGDMSTPSFGMHFPAKGRGLFVLTEQGTEWGDYSYTVRESDDRSQAEFLLRMPALREDSTRLGREARYPSPDRGASLHKGDEVRINARLYFFESPGIQALFNRFLHIRKDIGERTPVSELPYSAAWDLQEKKYNAQNWVEDYGYYSVGMRESGSQDWQTGWVGGLNTVFPLLLNGNEMTRERVLRTFDFIFKDVSPSGLVYGSWYKGVWRDRNRPAFLRRQADALYFMIKSYMLYEEWYPDRQLPVAWIQGARNMADAFARLFERYGQFGQHVDYVTGDIIAGTTASCGIAIGALAICSEYYNDPRYLEIARAAGVYYHESFVKIGLTNGGPGDIYQCPDSESAFGLLEGYMVLYEVTREEKWLQVAREIANQCATWVVSYDFRFPEQSTFNRLGMLTNGTVIANTQNKHSSPGICSLSGNSLFKLYRYTGEEAYLELISDIARAIPQFMSRIDRPIQDIRPDVPWPVMPPGWINERVNMSDWEERGLPGDIKRGEIFGGSTWAEVACMLTHAELPGVYVDKEKGIVASLDNINAEITGSSEGSIRLKLRNETAFDANVKVLAEAATDKRKRMPQDFPSICELVQVPAGGSITLEISKCVIR